MPLPQFRKWILVNNSGQTVTYAGSPGGRINIKETAIHYNTSTGKLVYTPLADDDLGFTTGTLANGAEIVGDNEIDNTSNLYIGSQVQIEVTHDAGALADGTFDVYMASCDATGQLQTDASGYASAEANRLNIVGSLTWEPNASDDDVQRSDVFNI